MANYYEPWIVEQVHKSSDFKLQDASLTISTSERSWI